MFGISVGLMIFLISLLGHNLCLKFKTFYYGQLHEGDLVVAQASDTVPYKRLVFSYDLTPKFIDKPVNITFLVVEYAQHVSNVHIVFDQKTNIVTFYIELPMIPMPFRMTGYASQNPNSSTTEDPSLSSAPPPGRSSNQIHILWF